MTGLWRSTAAAGLRRVGIRLSGKLPLRRFLRHNEGATAVEFALVALPFLALLFAIIETAMVFYAGQALETAAANAARLILTGQATMKNMTAATFKTEVCKSLTVMFDCSGGVYVDVRTYTSFGAISNTSPLTNGEVDTGKLKFDATGPNDIVVLRLYYAWPIRVSLWNAGLADMGNSKRLLVATTAFRNEPFQ